MELRSFLTHELALVDTITADGIANEDATELETCTSCYYYPTSHPPADSTWGDCSDLIEPTSASCYYYPTSHRTAPGVIAVT